MNERSVFEIHSMDKEKVHWEDYLHHLTPVETVTDSQGRKMRFKREDYFCPLGYHGINGAKLRQAVYLFSTYAQGKRRLINGTSVHSPQIPMATACARHFGLSARCVLGATTPETSMKHEMVAMASAFGCEFEYINIGYNHNLQLRCQEILNESPEDTFYLEYGITLNHATHSPKEVYDFHCIGAEQTKNLPDDVEDLVMAAGSCNSSCSVLLGLALHGYGNLKRIHLVGTGPSKIQYLTERLEVMGDYCGRDLRIFDGLPYTFDFDAGPRPLQAIFYDLHGEGYVRYSDLRPYTFGDIDLHPTYEGKVMTYLNDRHPDLIRESTLFWIVGNMPEMRVMKDFVDGK